LGVGDYRTHRLIRPGSEKAPAALRSGAFFIPGFSGCWNSGVKPLISLGWQRASKKISKCPKANPPSDDNHYEGSLGHFPGELPRPEAVVPNPTRNSSWL
jgi:hypothetical protein